jgi:hypothetical protein
MIVFRHKQYRISMSNILLIVKLIIFHECNIIEKKEKGSYVALPHNLRLTLPEMLSLWHAIQFQGYIAKHNLKT